MSRKIAGFAVNEANEKLQIEAIGEPGAGGANLCYQITGFDTATNESIAGCDDHDELTIAFQNGNPAENGVNGVTSEALLAILIDRHRGFAEGPFKSRENSTALTKLEEAMHWLQHRTRERLARGVEGKHLA